MERSRASHFRLATYSSATFITDLSIDLLIRKVEVITSLRSYCEDQGNYFTQKHPVENDVQNARHPLGVAAARAPGTAGAVAAGCAPGL